MGKGGSRSPRHQRFASSMQILLTEDLQANQDLDGLLVVNPFPRSPSCVIR